MLNKIIISIMAVFLMSIATAKPSAPHTVFDGVTIGSAATILNVHSICRFVYKVTDEKQVRLVVTRSGKEIKTTKSYKDKGNNQAWFASVKEPCFGAKRKLDKQKRMAFVYWWWLVNQK